MTSFQYTITEEVGLHARPAGQLVKQAQGHPDHNITISKADKAADAKRLFAVIGLAVRKGDEVTFTVEGPQEEEVARELQAFCGQNL